MKQKLNCSVRILSTILGERLTDIKTSSHGEVQWKEHHDWSCFTAPGSRVQHNVGVAVHQLKLSRSLMVHQNRDLNHSSKSARERLTPDLNHIEVLCCDLKRVVHTKRHSNATLSKTENRAHIYLLIAFSK